jgi:hypothetical protein
VIEYNKQLYLLVIAAMPLVVWVGMAASIHVREVAAWATLMRRDVTWRMANTAGLQEIYSLVKWRLTKVYQVTEKNPSPKSDV